MDRRDNPETADRQSEEQLRKALGVIIQSYKGAPPEKLYSEAIHCFNALIDISHNTDAIRAFASRNEIDLKYLVDGANFVISKMHFSPENNYYITLGLPQNASQVEIRERWKRLMLLYHPDRQEGDEEWVSERAKKVNEAYSTLKDKSKRMVYDRQLMEQVLNVKPASHPKVRTRAFSLNRAVRPSMNPEWRRTRKYLPKVLVGLYTVGALIFIGFIYLQNRSSHIETELFSEAEQTSETTLIPSQPPLVNNPPLPGKEILSQRGSTPPDSKNSPASGKEALPQRGSMPSDSKNSPASGKEALPQRDFIPPVSKDSSPPIFTPRRTSGKLASSSPKAARSLPPVTPRRTSGKEGQGSPFFVFTKKTGGQGGFSAKKNNDSLNNTTAMPDKPSKSADKIIDNREQKIALLNTITTKKQQPPHPSNSTADTADRKDETDSKTDKPQQNDTLHKREIAYNTQNTVEQKPAKQSKAFNNKNLQDTKALPASILKTDYITKEEIEEFMHRYIKAYEKNDLDTFMSFFSKTVVENNRMNYSAIRNAYKKTFSEKINYYKLRNMEVRIQGLSAFVSGNYNINRYLSTEDRWVRYKGEIFWKLIKENNSLKIISMNYGN